MRRAGKFRQLIHLALPVALLALLGLLAALQYRWLARVSQGEREVMRTALQGHVESFRRDFDQEITRAYTTFSVKANDLHDGWPSSPTAQFDAWTSKSAYPRLVREIYFIRPQVEPSLWRFDRTARRYQPADWPSRLATVRKAISLPPELRPVLMGPGSVFAEVPAVVSAVIPSDRSDDRSDEENWRNPRGYVVVEFDVEYIRRELIPSLGRRYLADDSSLTYDVLLVRRNRPSDIIFSSDTSQRSVARPTEAAVGDVAINLFHVGVAEIRTLSPRTTQLGSSGGTVTVVVPRAPPAADGESKSIVAVVDTSARWQLIVRQPGVSLDQAIAKARRLNLAVSFGVLLLLGASMALVVISSRRVQRLARQQVDFVAGVSHEFRTPLAVIKSLSENLAAGRIHDEQRVKSYGNTIHKDVRQLSEMVEQVLEYAGAQRDDRFYDFRAVDAAHLIEDVLAKNRSLLFERGWHVEEQIATDLPRIWADGEALKRALQNLLSNAIKYGGGEQRRLTVAAELDGRRRDVLITVSDQGTGIAAEDLPHIFEPFYRGRAVVPGKVHGSGLGLSLVKQIVEAHGGRVGVESSARTGSIFTVRLPAHDGTAEYAE